MSWKPRHEAHAIERVRIMLPFKDPLTSKLLSTAIKETVSKATEFGFDLIAPADSSIAKIQISANDATSQTSAQRNGIVLKRHVDGNSAEEVGFRDGAFGYVTNTYGRWENLRNRVAEVIYPALQNVDAAAELGAVKLEYWDRFFFDGEVTGADINGFLENFESSIPKEVLAGGSQWHSHIGWFEQLKNGPALINRNLDMADSKNDKAEDKRTLAVYTMIEQRSESGQISTGQVNEILEELHKRSLRLFGETLSNDYRKMIGINLDEYK